MTITPIGLSTNGNPVGFELNKLNRHGIIAGATGTGKTVTMKVMTEQLLQVGVPVFLADIKGDIASISKPATDDDKILKRAADLGESNYQPQAFNVRLWDVFGTQGTPVRASISDFGPLLLARILGLNDAQEGVLNVVFKIAEDRNLALVNLKDLQAMLKEVGDNNKEYTTTYGNVAVASVGAIQRSLLVLEQQGGEQIFGEPAINLNDFLAIDGANGIANILMAKQLFNSPRVYSTFLIYLLNKLFQILPEVGDPEKPKMVFFFDEAHLLFDSANQTFLDQVEQTVRLIRSKGVGVFFVTQNPADVPDKILSQLGNRVQHNLNAYSQADMRGVKAAAESFRTNPKIKDIGKAITELETGQALVSFLDDSGKPEVVEIANIYPPESQIDAINDAEINALAMSNPLDGQYRNPVNAQSAEEIIGGFDQQRKADKDAAEQIKADQKAEREAEKARKKNPVNKYGNLVVNTTIRSLVYKGVNSVIKAFTRK